MSKALDKSLYWVYNGRRKIEIRLKPFKERFNED